jgi:hypothetical protein
MSVGPVKTMADRWPPDVEADRGACGARPVVDAGRLASTGDAVADLALEILMIGEAEFAQDALHTATTSVRQAAERRIEQRATIRELTRRIEEAQQNRGWWQRFCDAFGWVGKALGALGGALAVVATGGAALPAALTIGLAAGASAGGLTAALGRLGIGAAERDAANLAADKLREEGELAEWQELGREGRALAEALVGAEAAMREQVLRWIDREDLGRRIGAAVVLDR